MSEYADAIFKQLAPKSIGHAWCLDPWGQKFDFENPGEYEYVPNRVAEMLSRIDRFQSQAAISVARHSLNVCRLMMAEADIDTRSFYGMAGLLHDVEEAWMGDMPTPLKRLCPGFCKVSDAVKDAAIDALWPPCASGLHYRYFSGDALHRVDSMMCQIERDLYMPDSPLWPRVNYPMPKPLRLDDVLFSREDMMRQRIDAAAWLRMYKQLENEIVNGG